MKLSFNYFGFYSQIVIVSVIIITETTAQSISCVHNNFGTIEVSPDVELIGAGQNIDTIEFWKAPDITNSLMFVSSKNLSVVEVWKYPFGTDDEQTPLTHTTLEPDNAEVNGLQVDQETDLLYVSVGSPNSHVSVFTLPDLEFVTNFNSNDASYSTEPNLTLLNLTNGDKHLYVSANTIVYIHNVSDAESENFGEYLGSFGTPHDLETMNADDYYQNLIIPDENTREGVYAYNPDGTDYPLPDQNNFGASTIQGDGEGIFLYNCSSGPTDQGIGFYVVSDQLSPNSEFEFYDRETWEYYGNLKVTGVSNTDGIASFPYSTPAYPMGVFAAINNDATTVIVDWETIFDEIAANGGLPVELTSFSGSVKNSTVTLNWETATEVNNYGFEVLRTSPHSPPYQGWKVEEWEKIGFIEGNGNSNSPKYYAFTDDNVLYGKYKYRLKQIDNDGTFDYSNEIEVFVGTIPSRIKLEKNYPNPFNPSTTIRFAVQDATEGYLIVYDAIGNMIAELFRGSIDAGRVYQVEFDGNSLASGIYIYRLHTLESIQSQKMMLLK
jgi:hypothetical protein